MTDADLLAAFEQGTLPPGSFTHREHVRVTWLYLGMYGRAGTERLLLQGLRAFAARAGKPDKFSADLTRSWIAAIEAARAGSRDASTFERFAAAHPHLLDPRAVLEA